MSALPFAEGALVDSELVISVAASMYICQAGEATTYKSVSWTLTGLLQETKRRRNRGMREVNDLVDSRKRRKPSFLISHDQWSSVELLGRKPAAAFLAGA
jgi:hypothetical protein